MQDTFNQTINSSLIVNNYTKDARVRSYLSNLYKAHSGQNGAMSPLFPKVPQTLNESNITLIILVAVLLLVAVIMLIQHAYFGGDS